MVIIVGLSIFQGGGLGTMGPGTVVPQYLSTAAESRPWNTVAEYSILLPT
jgi:hypothetical protein